MSVCHHASFTTDAHRLPVLSTLFFKQHPQVAAVPVFVSASLMPRATRPSCLPFSIFQTPPHLSFLLECLLTMCGCPYAPASRAPFPTILTLYSLFRTGLPIFLQQPSLASRLFPAVHKSIAMVVTLPADLHSDALALRTGAASSPMPAQRRCRIEHAHNWCLACDFQLESKQGPQGRFCCLPPQRASSAPPAHTQSPSSRHRCNMSGRSSIVSNASISALLPLLNIS